ncbi:hypothetical protein D3C85_1580400 [compost metagenome]
MVSRNDERFILTDQLTGRALAGQRYKIRLANGREIEGLTNAAGETTVAREEAAQGMTLLPPCDGSATEESK